MSIKKHLEKWVDALDSFDCLDYAEAYSKFTKFASNSREYFNIVQCLLKLDNVDEALEYLNYCLSRDKHFALAYFHRGSLNFKQGYIDNSLNDFQNSLELLRENQFIDYEQLGINFVLHRCEILFNIGLCLFELGETKDGKRFMEESKVAANSSSKDIDVSKIRKGFNERNNIEPFFVPPNILYRPSKDKVDSAKSVDYLGKAVVVAALDANDTFNGFSGRKIKENTFGRDYRKKLELFEVHGKKDDSEQKNIKRQNSEPLMRIPNRSSSTNHSRFSLNKLDRTSQSSRTTNSSSGDSDSKSKDSIQEKEFFIKIKLVHNGIRLIQVPISISYDDLLHKIRKKFGQPNMQIKYVDHQRELVLMDSNDSLDEAIDLGKDKIELHCV